jgi:hypothetical protein
VKGEEVGDGVFIEQVGTSIEGPREELVHRGRLCKFTSSL